MGVTILQVMLFMMDAYAQQEWRREMTVRLERIEGKLDRLYIAVIAGLLGVIAAVLASNWLG